MGGRKNIPFSQPLLLGGNGYCSCAPVRDGLDKNEKSFSRRARLAVAAGNLIAADV